MGSFKKNREVLLALCLCSALVNNVYAAETSKSQNDLEKYVLDEYVVTATKTALSEKKVPMATEVITQEKIKNLGAYSVRDALRMSIGLDVQETGMTGNVVQIRGMNNSHALILIDGRRMAGENTSVTANVYELEPYQYQRRGTYRNSSRPRQRTIRQRRYGRCHQHYH